MLSDAVRSKIREIQQGIQTARKNATRERSRPSGRESDNSQTPLRLADVLESRSTVAATHRQKQKATCKSATISYRLLIASYRLTSQIASDRLATIFRTPYTLAQIGHWACSLSFLNTPIENRWTLKLFAENCSGFLTEIQAPVVWAAANSRLPSEIESAKRIGEASKEILS